MNTPTHTHLWLCVNGVIKSPELRVCYFISLFTRNFVERLMNVQAHALMSLKCRQWTEHQIIIHTSEYVVWRAKINVQSFERKIQTKRQQRRELPTATTLIATASLSWNSEDSKSTQSTWLRLEATVKFPFAHQRFASCSFLSRFVSFW